MIVDLDYFKKNFFGYYKESFPVSFTQKGRIESCTWCKGTGRTSRKELSDYHKREYDTYHEDCKECVGQGRVIITDICVSFGDVPYSRDMNGQDLDNIKFQSITTPYDSKEANGIERRTEKKTFTFDVGSIREQP